MVYTSHRHQLAHVAPGGRFPLFTAWLRRRWTHQHRESPLEPIIQPADYAILTLALTDDQIEDLWWRGIIPPPGSPVGELHPFPHSSHARKLVLLNGVQVVDDPVFEQQLYQLPSGEAIRLRLGELEQLAEAGYPATPGQVVMVLWQEIGSLSAEPHYRLASRLRAICAALYTPSNQEPAAVLDQLRALLPPSSSADDTFLWLLNAEHHLLKYVAELLRDEEGDGELFLLIRAWRVAQGNLVLWNLPDIHTQIDQTARMFAPSVADNPQLMRRIEAVRGVIAATLAALAPEGVGGDEDDPLFDASDLYIAVEQLQRVMAAR
jgi:hypothetical protein